MEFPWNFLDPSAGELHQREVNGLVVSHCKKGTVFIFQIRRLYLAKELCSTPTKVTVFQVNVSVAVIVPFFGRVLCGKAHSNLHLLLVPIKVGVYDASFFGLEGPIKHFKDVPSNELVVTVEDHHNRVFAALV